ncbi:hypothetical protein [Nesterenkonia alkaliphila]|uniref:Uncharacterized protein n=1 Tax=Nesterenkonia alkaliphila TaxID=1463631 RepID=A0A7K1UJI0_9MICC|nr:hypothetical protein [Nesterenkonia alkaliphila]MVT26648.1 hypothetical protein [Nesterenkonia alkaliphila]GFZ78059.1 hypothetical protein GCM10011359_02780 [Nesterenkonia alkaliphila]
MVAHSPEGALGRHAQTTRDLLIEVVRSRHDRSADAHEASGSRYAIGFGGQWRDLLDDAREALAERGFQSRRLAPGGYQLPVVNDCLVYVWRVPGAPDAVSRFASSPTRRNGFFAPPPEPMLEEPAFWGLPERDSMEEGEVDELVRAAGDPMPLVIVMVHSTPRQLQSIEWAIAELNSSGKVTLHGQDCIWEPEFAAVGATTDVESFSDGVPVAPVLKPREHEGTGSDA